MHTHVSKCKNNERKKSANTEDTKFLRCSRKTAFYAPRPCSLKL
jgi:hypothetical protein